MNTQQKGRIAGLFGIVVLFSAGLAWLVTGRIADPYVWVQAALAVAGIVAFFVTNLGKLGEQFAGRGAFYAAVSAVMTAVLFGALVGVNYIAVKKPKQWDLS